MGRVIHFELKADDSNRAVDFYKKVFGWVFQEAPQVPGYFLAATGPGDQPGINGAVMQGQGQPTIITIDVEDLDKAIETALASGGTLVNTRQTIPGVGYHAYVADPSGNVIGMMQEDRNVLP